MTIKKLINNYLNLKFITFLIIYFVTCVLLIYMEHFLYGGTVNTNYIVFAVFPFIVLLEKRKNQTNNDTSSTSISRIVLALFLGILISIPIFILYKLYRNPYNFEFYFYFFFILFGVFYTIEQKKRSVITSTYTTIRLLCHIYILLFIVSVVYILILSPTTVKKANIYLTKSHYTNVTFIGSEDDLTIMNIIFKGEIASEKNRDDLLGYYIFSGILDNKEQYIVVSVTEGRIILSTDVTQKNQELIEMAY